MTRKIPSSMVFRAERKIHQQGNSLVVSLPPEIKGVEKGATVKVYVNNLNQILIDLTPEQE